MWQRVCAYLHRCLLPPRTYAHICWPAVRTNTCVYTYRQKCMHQNHKYVYEATYIYTNIRSAFEMGPAHVRRRRAACLRLKTHTRIFTDPHSRQAKDLVLLLRRHSRAQSPGQPAPVPPSCPSAPVHLVGTHHRHQRKLKIFMQMPMHMCTLVHTRIYLYICIHIHKEQNLT
jgi:hypothetical protein